MANFEKRKKFKHFLYSKITVGVLAVITIFLIFSVVSVFEKRQEAYRNAKIAEHELEMLRENEARTKESIAKLDTQAGVEEAIRNKYRAAKEGEGLVVITDDTRTVAASSLTVQPEKKSWWQSFLSIFK